MKLHLVQCFFDLVAYIGDQAAFYIDYSLNENNIDTAVELKNVLKLAKQKRLQIHKFANVNL
jgi:hypothetical protein